MLLQHWCLYHKEKQLIIGHAKVSHFGNTIVVDQDITQFNVMVDKTNGVEVMERLNHARHKWSDALL